MQDGHPGAATNLLPRPLASYACMRKTSERPAKLSRSSGPVFTLKEFVVQDGPQQPFEELSSHLAYSSQGEEGGGMRIFFSPPGFIVYISRFDVQMAGIWPEELPLVNWSFGELVVGELVLGKLVFGEKVFW